MDIHQGKKFSCDLCGKEFAQKGFVTQHKKIVHFMQKRPTKKCDKCEYETSENRHLKSHIESKHSNLIFPCKICKYVGPSKELLILHKRRKHHNSIHKCSLCAHTAKHEKDLHIHYQNKHVLQSNFKGMEF